MAYPVQVYLSLNDKGLLQQRFDNLEPLIKIYTYWRDFYLACAENSEYCKLQLLELKGRIDELKNQCGEILNAIQNVSAYAGIQNPLELEKMITREMPIIAIMIEQYNHMHACIYDLDLASKGLIETEMMLDDLQKEARNIISAMEILE